MGKRFVSEERSFSGEIVLKLSWIWNRMLVAMWLS